MTNYEAEKMFQEQPLQGTTQHHKVIFYRGEAYHQEVENLTRKISELISERKKIIDSVLVKIQKPSGWEIALNEKDSTFGSGRIRYTVQHNIFEEVAKKPVIPVAVAPPRQLTHLEKYLQIIDAKTLFNSGLLTKEEKKALLDEHIKEQNNDNR